MSQDDEPPHAVAFSIPEAPDEAQTTFRIFRAQLDPAMQEALRGQLRMTPGAIDERRPQSDFISALRDLRELH